MATIRSAYLSNRAILPWFCISALNAAYANAGDEGSVEEIVVTAQRDAARLSDVPASVSVLTQAAIERTGTVNLQQAVQLTSGVSISTGAADVGDTQVNIRGLNGTRDAENNVALVVDGILKTNTSQLNQLQGGLTQIEVLKGPQGAYYGRNAEAGAIIITTEKPGQSLAGHATLGGGENSLYYAQGSVGGALTPALALLGHMSVRNTDGFYRNTGPDPVTRGDTVDRLKQWEVDGRAIFKPFDAFELDFKSRFGRADGGALAYDVVFNLPGFVTALGSPLFNESVNTRHFAFTGNIYPDNQQRTIEESIKGTWGLGWADLTAWMLYSNVAQDFVADGTAGGAGRFNATAACQASTAALYAEGVMLPPPQLLGPTPNASLFGAFGPTTCDGYQYTVRDQTDWSTEVRLSADHGAFAWSAGAYYLYIDRHFGLSVNEDEGLGTTRQVYNPPASISPTSIEFDDIYHTNVYAGFGSIRYTLVDALTLSAALRYDREERKVRSIVPDARDPVTGQLINPGLALGPLVPKSQSFDQVEPKLNALYRAQPWLSLYADWGVGFKAGGFNQQGTAALVQNDINAPLGKDINVGDEFKKEVSYASEVGFKARSPDGRFAFEGSFYDTKVHDMQFFEVFTGGFGLVRTVSNIDRVTLEGGELDATVKVLPVWSLYASGNITHSRIDRNSARSDAVGNKSPYTPDYTVNVGSDFTVPLRSSLSAFARIDVRTTGPTWFSTVQAQNERTLIDLAFPGLGVGNYAKTQRDAFTVVNLRIGLQGDRAALTVFATNLLNQRTIDEVIPAPEFGGSFVAPGALRTVGAEASVSF